MNLHYHTWHPATYVGADPVLRGKNGLARHDHDNWWVFVPNFSEEHQRPQELEVYCTEIDVQARAPEVVS